jgi:hypothetical protein
MAAVTLGTGSAATAAPLGLTMAAPDIFSNNVLFNFDIEPDGDRVFTATGEVNGADLGALGFSMYEGGTYTLSAIIDPVTQAATGNIRLSGAVFGSGLAPDTLLEGNITRFGYATATNNPATPDDSGEFQFVFDVTDGELMPIFGPQGGTSLGVSVISAGWNFSTPFSGLTVADTVAVPEPLAVSLMAFGAGAAMAWRRRTRRGHASPE